MKSPTPLASALALAILAGCAQSIPSREVQLARQAEQERLSSAHAVRDEELANAAPAPLVESRAPAAKLVSKEDQRALYQDAMRELSARQTRRGWVVTLGQALRFDAGKVSLRQDAAGPIAELARVLGRNPAQEITIEGFTDSAGTRQANLALSHRRAEAVKRTLMQHGVNGSRIHTRGYGESYPVASNRGEAGRRLNRRVEIIIPSPGTRVSLRSQ